MKNLSGIIGEGSLSAPGNKITKHGNVYVVAEIVLKVRVFEAHKLRSELD